METTTTTTTEKPEETTTTTTTTTVKEPETTTTTTTEKPAEAEAKSPEPAQEAQTHQDRLDDARREGLRNHEADHENDNSARARADGRA